MFFTKGQATLLTSAKTWYIDSTCKIISRPFSQLFSINVFVKSNTGSLTQVPVVFVIMSGKSFDYRIMLVILEKLPVEKEDLGLHTVMMDFEAAMWSAFKEVLPANVRFQGCDFLSDQAIRRKIQELGMVTAYNRRQATYKFCRKIMALAYVPAEHIPVLFNKFKETVTNSNAALKEPVTYVENTWITSDMWHPSSWCIFSRSIHTNNDIEGWHRRLNYRMHNNSLSFHVLVAFLQMKAKDAILQLKLVAEDQLLRHQRATSRNKQDTIFSAWDQYSSGHIEPRELLSIIVQINGPIPAGV